MKMTHPLDVRPPLEVRPPFPWMLGNFLMKMTAPWMLDPPLPPPHTLWMLKNFWKIAKSIVTSATKYYQEFHDRPHPRWMLGPLPPPLDVG